MLDIKGAFNNIPIAEKMQPYCAILTQDKVYCYNKMTFGFNSAPAHYQFIIYDALDYIHPTIPQHDQARGEKRVERWYLAHQTYQKSMKEESFSSSWSTGVEFTCFDSDPP